MNGYEQDLVENNAKLAEQKVSEAAALERQREFDEKTSEARQALEVECRHVCPVVSTLIVLT
jgi:hypothetical protein